jgi:hypothetical protein
MLFSSLCLCRFIDFWSTSLSNSGFCRAIDRSARWCVCVLDYTYFTWYECPSRNFFFRSQFFSLLACVSAAYYFCRAVLQVFWWAPRRFSPNFISELTCGKASKRFLKFLRFLAGNSFLACNPVLKG